MTAFGLLVAFSGAALLWQGITNNSALAEIQAAILGKPLPKPLHKGGQTVQPIGGASSGSKGAAVTPPSRTLLPPQPGQVTV